jgi:hypothetical protein
MEQESSIEYSDSEGSSESNHDFSGVEKRMTLEEQMDAYEQIVNEIEEEEDTEQSEEEDGNLQGKTIQRLFS